MTKFFEDNSFSIGNTPMAKINQMARGLKATVLAKIEGRNPAYSVKCRIGASMIWDAEEKGLLKPGMEIISSVFMTWTGFPRPHSSSASNGLSVVDVRLCKWEESSIRLRINPLYEAGLFDRSINDSNSSITSYLPLTYFRNLDLSKNQWG